MKSVKEKRDYDNLDCKGQCKILSDPDNCICPKCQVDRETSKVIHLTEQLAAEKEARVEVEAQLFGVMHFVDKWFDDDDPRLAEDADNPAQRSNDAREIALQAIEEQEVEIERLRDLCDSDNALHLKAAKQDRAEIDRLTEERDDYRQASIEEFKQAVKNSARETIALDERDAALERERELQKEICRFVKEAQPSMMSHDVIEYAKKRDFTCFDELEE